MLQVPQNIQCAYHGTQFWSSRKISGLAEFSWQLRQCVFAFEFSGVQSLVSALFRAGFSHQSELCVRLLKPCVGTVISTQSQNPTSRVFYHASGLEHDLLHDRLLVPTLGRLTYWRFFANECFLANQTQDVQLHRCQGAIKEVGVKLSTGQTLQVHIGLELGRELLVRSLVFVQVDDVVHRKLLRQCRRPTCQLVGGHQQGVPVRVYSALCQAQKAQKAPSRIGLGANAVQVERVSPQTHALAFAQMAPDSVGGCHLSGCDCVHGRFARIPLDDEDDLARQDYGLTTDLFHNSYRTQTRVGRKLKGQLRQLGCHWQYPLQLQISPRHRVLHARATNQFQAVDQVAQIGGAGGVTVHTLVSSHDGFILGARVVHHKNIPVHGHVDAGQDTRINGVSCVFGQQQGLVELARQVKSRGCMDVYALTQRRARWYLPTLIARVKKKRHHPGFFQWPRSRSCLVLASPSRTSKCRC